MAAGDQAIVADEKGKFLDVSWTVPPVEVEVGGETKQVAPAYGFALYRWDKKQEVAGKGGPQESNLYRVFLGKDWSQYRDENVRPNEIYHYAVVVLTQNMEAQDGSRWDCRMSEFLSQELVQFPLEWGETEKEEARNITALLVSRATEPVSAKVPDNVELKLQNFLNGKAAIKIVKRFKDNIKVEAVDYVLEGEQIGKKSMKPLKRMAGAQQKYWDMTTKYTLVKIIHSPVPIMAPSTWMKVNFNGGKQTDWTNEFSKFKQEHPDAKMERDPKTRNLIKEIRMIPAMGSDGKPKMRPSHRMVVRDVDGNESTYNQVDRRTKSKPD